MPKSPEVEDEKFIEALRALPAEGHLPSTSEVRDAVNGEYGADYDRKTVYRRLDALESEGEIDKIEVGKDRGKSIGWFVSGTFSVGDTDELARTRTEPDGGLTGFESRVFWYAAFGLFAGVMALLATGGLWLAQYDWYPKLWEGVFITELVLYAGLFVFSASTLGVLYVVFREYIELVKRRFRSEWQLCTQRLAPYKEDVERWVGANRPGGSA